MAFRCPCLPVRRGACLRSTTCYPGACPSIGACPSTGALDQKPVLLKSPGHIELPKPPSESAVERENPTVYRCGPDRERCAWGERTSPGYRACSLPGRRWMFMKRQNHIRPGRQQECTSRVQLNDVGRFSPAFVDGSVKRRTWRFRRGLIKAGSRPRAFTGAAIWSSSPGAGPGLPNSSVFTLSAIPDLQGPCLPCRPVHR
jgi:hypothetical protein